MAHRRVYPSGIPAAIHRLTILPSFHVPTTHEVGQLQLELVSLNPGPGLGLRDAMAAQTRRVKLLALVELLGFFGIFTAMIVLHFS